VGVASCHCYWAALGQCVWCGAFRLFIVFKPEPAIFRTGVSSLCASTTSPRHALCFCPVFLTFNKINCLVRLSGTLSLICGVFIPFWLNSCVYFPSQLLAVFEHWCSCFRNIEDKVYAEGFRTEPRPFSPAAVPQSRSGNDGFPVDDVLVEKCRGIWPMDMCPVIDSDALLF